MKKQQQPIMQLLSFFIRSLKTKKFLVAAAMLFFFSYSYSQVLMVGPRVGISSSKVKLQNAVQDAKEGDARFGFHAGFFGRLTISSVYVQPEILFTNNGGKIEFDDGAGERIVTEYEFNKLDVPVMIGYKLAFLRLQVGPVASLILKADAKEGGVTEDVKDRYKDATVGYQAGIGVDIGSLILDLKYEGNLSKFGEDIEIGGVNTNTDLRNNQWLLSVGLKL